MPHNGSPSPKRKISRAASSRRLKAFANKARPNLGLALDTTVARHRGDVPQQVFPYDSGSVTRVEPATNATYGLRAQLENNDPVRPAVPGSTTANASSRARAIGLPSRPDLFRSQTVAPVSNNSAEHDKLGAPALHKRIKGLRPSPLDLTDISPSDRAIPIGIALPTNQVARQNASALSHGSPDEKHQYGHEATTPTIIITPAREDFDLHHSPGLLHSTFQRPASSVYSRHTDGLPGTARYEATPPVPPLPLFAQKLQTHVVRESTATVFEESPSAQSHKATISVCTVFEEEQDALSPLRSARSVGRQYSRRLTSHSALPTPRRSKGWWNLITSPFLARTEGGFWRYPVQQSPDGIAILSDVSAMGMADNADHGEAQTDESLGERSATLGGSLTESASGGRLLPKRSFTAPGALGANAPNVNIYRIPSQGEAAAYYDTSKHFPSLLLGSSDSLPRSFFEDDSPLTDVCACEHHNHGRRSSDKSDAGSTDSHQCNADAHLPSNDGAGSLAASKESPGDIASPFSDAHAISKQESTDAFDRGIFTSPTADELVPATPHRPTPDRSQTQGTIGSQFSPFSETPVVESAHIATIIGPKSDLGEQRAVMVTPSRTPDPPAARGLRATTMASRNDPEEGIHAEMERAIPERPMMHSRNDSYGLGITSEKELFPPPKMISERPRLGTDRFGQLKLVIPGQEKPNRPWYRSFFWLLASLSTAALLLLVVLLVMLLPLGHADAAVQGQWLNLTGYPALPTGVTTVVQPNTVSDIGGCVKPSGLWSCAMPQSQRSLSGSGASSQPNFRLEIRFKNGSSENATALRGELLKRSGPAAARRTVLSRRSIGLTGLFSPTPAPPFHDDQLFMGRTTDNVSMPFDGEETPFFLSLLDTAPLSRLLKRQDNPYPYPTANIPANSTSDAPSKNASTVAPGSVPKADLGSNGGPSPAMLYPLAQAQPLRLYNRDQEDEHYGFYTYFDRTVYVANTTDSQSSANISLSADATLKDATAVCTWSQTRLRVSIWTRKAGPGIASDNPDSSTTLGVGNGTTPANVAAVNSTANDMTAPGSFPYPITISIDRHGGDAKRKGAYCHGLNENHKVTSASMWIPEDRAFDGYLVNPAAVPGSSSSGSRERDEGIRYGGVDGGTGGCGCSWANWK